MATTSEPSTLAALISAALPSSTPPLHIHHIWHSPSKADALYSPPKGISPEPTTLSSHFLAVSLPSPSPILVFGIEVLIFSTSTRTTLFVSKADSTGFLSPASSKSPSSEKRAPTSVIRTVTSTFLSYLIDKSMRKSPHKITHVSLFARAQDQYLFPNSVKNGGKHVLSDHQLIRWWARCLNPLLQSFGEDAKAQGYLLVPGLDRYECRALFPPGAPRWVHGHPYVATTEEQKKKAVRECIPHFPDDPKSRFMMELEVDNGVGWKGMTMESFWELMAFRQECSLGKSVGFLSVVVPPSAAAPASQSFDSSQATIGESNSQQSTQQQPEYDSQATASQSSQKSDSSTAKKAKEKRYAERMSTYTGASLLKNPERLKRFPRGRLIRSKSSNSSKRDGSQAGASQLRGGTLSKKEYDRLLESLLNSDFGGRKFAEGSSKKWIDIAGGEEVVGTKKEEASASAKPLAGAVNVLTVVRKRPVEESNGAPPENHPQVNILPTRKKSKISLIDGDENTKPEALKEPSPINTLSSNLIRKKTKPDDSEKPPAAASDCSTEVGNTLSSSLVRKKPKPETPGEDKTKSSAPAAPADEKSSEPGVDFLSDSFIRKKPTVPVE